MSVGLVDKARQTAQDLVTTYLPFAEQGIPIVGLEPSCTLALRDEVPAFCPQPKPIRSQNMC